MIFSRGTLYSHFEKLSKHEIDVYKNQLLQNLESGSGLYNKNTPENKKALIDDLRPILLETYLQIKTMVYQQKLYQNAYKNIVPFSVLSAIQQEMETIKADENIVPISEFNYIISDAIKISQHLLFMKE